MKIYNRWDGSKVIFEDASGTLRETVLAARANLTGADLTDIKNDLWDVLLRAPMEVSGLLLAPGNCSGPRWR